MIPTRIISGGQTGADRGGLDAALVLGIAHGGWVPRGRRAEDGPVPLQYEVREMASPEYDDRTRRNVVEADGTVIFTVGPPTGGSKLTYEHAMTTAKPVLSIELGPRCVVPPGAVERFRRWLEGHQIRTLNVAGSRESGTPGMQRAVRDFLIQALRADT